METPLLHTREIKPRKGIVPINLKELWEYKQLVYFFIWRDVKGRYRQTMLGPLWYVIQPLLNTVLFTVIFGKLARMPSDGVPYPLFNYSAMILWTLFASATMVAATSLLTYRNLISKVYFPRLTVPLAGVFSSCIDFLISFIILIGVMYYFGYPPTWNILYAPLFVLMTAMVSLSVGLWCATATLHFHDVTHILNFSLRLWMFSSPVVYALSAVPEKWLPWIKLNPMVHIIDGFRWSLLGVGTPPDAGLLKVVFVVLIVLVTGAFHFRKTERTIVDIA